MPPLTLPIRVPVILHGNNSLENLKAFPQKRILIITGRSGKKLAGDRLRNIFSGREVMFFDEVEPNPSDRLMYRAGDLAREFKPEMILGIGGGSALDTAKAVYFLYGQPDKKLAQVDFYTSYNLKSRSSLVLVPTTSGTGSECSAGCVYTDSVTGGKIDILSPEFIPGVIVLDPTLVVSMPKDLTIASGIDALAQAIESSSSILNCDIFFGLNAYAIRSLLRFLPQAAGSGANDMKVREKVHYATTMAGIAMGNASLGIGHACGHAVGAVYDMPHGISVGIMLPYFIEYNREVRKDNYAEILDCLNIEATSDPAARLSALVKDFLKRLDVPESFRAFGISEIDWQKNISRCTDFVLTDATLRTTPRPPAGSDDVRKLLQYAYDGKSVDF